MKLFTRLLNPRFQFFFFAVLALFVTGLVAFCSPEQFPIVRYKLSLGMLAAVIAVFFDMAAFRALLTRQLAASVTADEAAWKTEYVCKPSLFIHDKSSDFYPSLAAVCETECRFLRAAQAPDGTWPLTWAWGAYPAQWAVSENWWKADLILKNTRFLEAMRG